jgi:hypothetical protein
MLGLGLEFIMDMEAERGKAISAREYLVFCKRIIGENY